MLGGLLGAALFLMEAGTAQVFLARDAECRAHAPPSRVGAGRQNFCLGTGEVAMLQSLSRGVDRPLAVQVSDVLPVGAWLLNAAVYFGLGGFSAQLRGWWGAALLLGLNIVLVALLTALRFMAPYIG